MAEDYLKISGAFVIGIFMLILLVWISIISSDTLSTSAGLDKTLTGSFVNQTGNFTNSTNGGLSTVSFFSPISQEAITLSSVSVTNRSTGTVIPATNYTINGGTITAVAATATQNSLDQFVNVSASYSYTYPADARSIRNNVSLGYGGFTSNIGTMFILIAVVLILAIIGVVIFIIYRFREGKIAEGL